MSRKEPEIVFCSNLNNLMYSRGTSAADVYRGTGISEREIRYYRDGRRAPNINNASKIATFFNVSLDEMVNDVHDEWGDRSDWDAEWF